MEALIQELKNSIEVPNSSLLEEIQNEFSLRVHTPSCFHGCYAVVESDSPDVLYTRINIIAGIKTVFTIVRCPVCNSITVILYEYTSYYEPCPTFVCIYREKLETALNIHTFFKEYAPHIYEHKFFNQYAPREVEVPNTPIIHDMYIVQTLTNYYTYLLIQNKQKPKLHKRTDTNSIMQYCILNTPTASPIQKTLFFITRSLSNNVAPALLYYLLNLPTLCNKLSLNSLDTLNK